MSSVSADNQKPWRVAVQDRPAGLEVILLDRTLVLPWSQFLFAEGGDDEYASPSARTTSR